MQTRRWVNLTVAIYCCFYLAPVQVNASVELEAAAKVLGVPVNASEEDVLAKFRRLALANHPDRFNGDPAKEALFKKINDANSVFRAYFRSSPQANSSQNPSGAAESALDRIADPTGDELLSLEAYLETLDQRAQARMVARVLASTTMRERLVQKYAFDNLLMYLLTKKSNQALWFLNIVSLSGVPGSIDFLKEVLVMFHQTSANSDLRRDDLTGPINEYFDKFGQKVVALAFEGASAHPALLGETRELVAVASRFESMGFRRRIALGIASTALRCVGAFTEKFMPR
jgi:hypothetical protein